MGSCGDMLDEVLNCVVNGGKVDWVVNGGVVDCVANAGTVDWVAYPGTDEGVIPATVDIDMADRDEKEGATVLDTMVDGAVHADDDKEATKDGAAEPENDGIDASS